ncbi:hypothetical protein FF1_019168 [Malus domestica]
MTINHLSQNVQDATRLRNNKSGYESLVEATTVASKKFKPEKTERTKPRPIYWWCTVRALDWDPDGGSDLIVDDGGNATHYPTPKSSSTPKTQVAPSNLGFSSAVSKPINPLRAKATRGGIVSGIGSALGACMVSLPSRGEDRPRWSQGVY